VIKELRPIRFSPANMQRIIPVDQPITIEFNHNLRLNPTVPLPVLGGFLGNITAEINGSILTLTPDNLLGFDSAFQLQIPADLIESSDGSLSIDIPIDINFTTEADGVTIMNNHQEQTPTGGEIAAIMNKDITEGPLFTNITLKHAIRGNTVKATFRIEENRLIISPEADLDEGTEYIAVIPAGALLEDNYRPFRSSTLRTSQHVLDRIGMELPLKHFYFITEGEALPDRDGDGIPNDHDMYPDDGPLGDYDGDGILNKDDDDDSDGPALSDAERYYLQGYSDNSSRIPGNIYPDTQPYPERNCGYYGDFCEQGTQKIIPNAEREDSPVAYPEQTICENDEYLKQGVGICIHK
jgi:hypothetical protein